MAVYSTLVLTSSGNPDRNPKGSKQKRKEAIFCTVPIKACCILDTVRYCINIFNCINV